MEAWAPYFVAVVALGVVIQTIVLVSMAVGVLKATKNIQTILTDLQGRVHPILTRVQILVEESQPRINSIIADAADISGTVRAQVQRVDQSVTETLDRVHSLLALFEQKLNGAIESVEDTGTKIKNTVWAPVRSMTAVMRGIQTGVEFYKGHRRRGDGDGEPDDSLFI